MKNRWTGGQYSLFRVVIALYLFVFYLEDLAFLPTIEGFFALIALAVLPLFLVGKRDRIIALILIALLLGRLIIVGMDLGTVTLLSLMIFHAFLPRAPFGAYDAKNRPDPKGNWRLPQRFYVTKWIIIWLLYWWWAFWPNNSAAGGLEFAGVAAFGLLSLGSHIRPYIWLGMWLWQIALHLFGDLNSALLLAHIALFDPGWIPPARKGREYILFYDGSCDLCSTFVRFILAERAADDQMKFAPLGGATANAMRLREGNTTVVLYHQDKTYVRWKAIAEVLREIGGIWRLLAPFVTILPSALYNWIADHRHRFHKKHCLVMPKHLTSSFLP